MPSRLLTLLLVSASCARRGGLRRATTELSAGQLVDGRHRSCSRTRSASKPQAQVRRRSTSASAAGGRPAAVKLTGPFESEGKGKLPKLRLRRASTAAARALGGVTSTGDKGFVTLDGTTTSVSDLIVQQFKAGYEQAGAARTSSAARSALDSTQLADQPAQRGRRQGRRRRHDQDHRRRSTSRRCSTTSTAIAAEGPRCVRARRPAAELSAAGAPADARRGQGRSTSRSTPARTTGSCAGWSWTRRSTDPASAQDRHACRST